MRLAAIALFLVGFTFGTVHAGPKKVDWSQYLEKPGERTPKKETPTVAAEPKAKGKKAKATRSAQRPAKAVAKRKGGRRR